MTPSRVRHVDNGWLRAHDLRDQPRLADERLARHHTAAHRTWGVSAGLTVASERGRIIVGRGFAVDRCGRTGILAQPFDQELARAGLGGESVAVVLEILGDGPRARVRLREPGAVRDFDVPLATIGADGAVRGGDGDRQWLRAPGPARTLGGIVPRGWPLREGSPVATALVWSVQVDLSEYRLAGVPAVVATAAGLPPGTPSPRVAVRAPGAVTIAPVFTTTLEVSALSAAGFDITVRHHVAPDDALLGIQSDARTVPEIRTSPMPIGWTALLPADRPSVPTAEESP